MLAKISKEYNIEQFIHLSALGIENADKSIRLETSKGKFDDVDIKKVVSQIHESGINVMANYIYGLPGDTEETIKKT